MLIDTVNLPWEAIPTEYLKDARVWKALFYNGMGTTALVRNVTRFDRIDAFNDLKFAGDVAKKIADPEAVAKGKVHPVQYLNALFGAKKQGVNAKVLGALEDAFYASFGNVEPANKRTYIGIDCSASMTWGAPAGLVNLNYMEAAAAIAMVTVRTEPYVEVFGFSTTPIDLGISDRDSIETVVQKISRGGYGGTDCAQPMLHSLSRKQEIDTFVCLTDNETWAGRIKPSQALVKYRNEMNIPARLAVVGMAAVPFTIADKDDAGMMDFVGLDSNGPAVLADFSAGRL